MLNSLTKDNTIQCDTYESKSDFILMIVCSVSEIIHLNHNEIEECNK